MRAAWNGHRDVVESLIAAGARVDVTDRAGSNALGYASREGHADIVALLRAAGAR
jgi:ankyrin repeat protein